MKVRFIYSQLTASLSSPTHSNEDQVQQPTPTETKAKAWAQIKCESNSKKTQNGISHLFTEKCCLLMNEAKFRYGKRGVWPCLWYIQIIFVATCKHKKRKLLLFTHLSFIVHLIARSFTKYLLSRIHANGAAPDNLLQNSIFQLHRLHFGGGRAKIGRLLAFFRRPFISSTRILVHIGRAKPNRARFHQEVGLTEWHVHALWWSVM